jgi:hypothetical protein
MATTTTNFNFPIPQSTDLVKDGATAIAALGTSVDTQFVDLKGGTTGQVLAKASGTDLDFSWVAQDDSNAIQNAIVDAKGDLIAASAADTPARLAVGNNGEIIVADSSTSTGLRWQGHIEAGKNGLINGAMDIWQRGTSSTSNLVYLADRWFNYTSAGTTTFSRESTIVPTGSQYSMKIAQATASATITVNQAIETSNAIQYAGQTVTISMMCYASASTGFQMQLGYSTSTDVGPLGSWTNITASSGGAATVTNAWQKMTGTFVVPSTAKSLYVSLFIPTLASGTNAYFGQAMLELGSVSTSFSRAGGSIAGELVLCQRYYYNQKYTAGGQTIAIGSRVQATEMKVALTVPVVMRVAPTVTTSASSTFTTSFSVATISAINSASSISGFVSQISFAVNSGTTGTTAVFESNNSSCSIEWSAEL